MTQINPMPGHRCARCETLPDSSCRTGSLYLSPPMGPTAEAIENIARAFCVSLSHHSGRTLELDLTEESGPEICGALASDLGQMELDDTRCLFLAEDESFDIGALDRVCSLGEFLSVRDNQWFIELLEDERLVSWFQPIVQADQPGQVFAYECLVRGEGRQGETILPGALFDTARRSDLLFFFDRLCRQTAIRSAWAHRITTQIFINFNPTSIYNPVHCLKSTLETMAGTGLSFKNVVFEVVETDKVRDVSHLLKIVNYYKEMGFGLALDDIGAGYSSLNLLHQINPDYIKIDLDLIRDVHTDRSKGVIVKNLLGIARDLGIKSIAEGVETHGEWQWLCAHGADYLQGYLFAKPEPVPVVPALS